ncbi:uncharacterized protein LOC143001775 [Genypterus blacodes]|uniref:uncharacterized protein LOC143001775 n=1 Tax=Genypterus blacodes TaxID=154954 RepID=UPI003F770898
MPWRQWLPNLATEAIAATSSKREPNTTSRCPKAKKPPMARPLYPVVALSTLCSLLLVTCIALIILYNKEADSKPEWNGLLSDYQNISDRYLALAKANQGLKRENQHLQELNARLDHQTKLLNRSSATLASVNRALTSESSRLQQQVTNLTSANLRLAREREQLVERGAEQEERNANMSQAVTRLINSHAELAGERQNLSETNVLLRHELLQTREKNREMAELNDRFQGEIRNLSEEMGAEALQRDECEAAASLQEQNRNLSRMLEEERSGAAQYERSQREETEQKEAAMNSLSEAYQGLDLYCPVVNQQTKERACKRCSSGWRLFDTKCYYISVRLLTWSSSRAWCQTQGGDLLLVNSQEEQNFVFTTSRAVDQTSSRVWIGMTDAEREGEWRWVDGSSVRSDTQFWLSRPGMGTEPDDWKQDDPQGEDCGHIETSEAAPLLSWMDASCNLAYRWICEKNP